MCAYAWMYVNIHVHVSHCRSSAYHGMGSVWVVYALQMWAYEYQVISVCV